MKKALLFVSALVMVVSLAACGRSTAASSDGSAPAEAPSAGVVESQGDTNPMHATLSPTAALRGTLGELGKVYYFQTASGKESSLKIMGVTRVESLKTESATWPNVLQLEVQGTADDIASLLERKDAYGNSCDIDGFIRADYVPSVWQNDGKLYILFSSETTVDEQVYFSLHGLSKEKNGDSVMVFDIQK